MDKVVKEITKYLLNYDSIEKVMLFGSRARGDNHDRSDYDIAIFGDISSTDSASIKYFLSEEIATLHKIDCVFVSKIEASGKLFENIITEGIVIYEN